MSAVVAPAKPVKGKPPVKGQPAVKPMKGQPVAVKSARRDVFVDTMWALINTHEFIFNH